jgi:hypothetical protein
MLIGHKKFKPTDSFITYKKGTFKIRLDAYLYRTANDYFYGYVYPTDELMLLDVDAKKQVLLEPIRKSDEKTALSSA